MKREKNLHPLMPLAVVAVWLVLLPAWCLMGCTTKRLTEYVQIHDTIVTTHTDTLRITRTLTRTDTLREEQQHLITLSPLGDTLREVHYIRERQSTQLSDTTERYRSLADSLLATVDRMSARTVVEKPANAFIMTFKLGLALLTLALLIFIYKKLRG